MTTIFFEKSFSLLSNMYLCKPTRETMAVWKALLADDVIPCLMYLKNAADKILLDSEKELQDLLWEYTRLFIGPAKLPCPPWESVYTSTQKLLMQDAFHQVKKWYHGIGLTINNPDIMEDHIGVELNFLAVLFHKMGSDAENKEYYEETAKRFVDEHLAKWVPRFTSDMEQAAESQFYKALAQTTRQCLLALASVFQPFNPKIGGNNPS